MHEPDYFKSLAILTQLALSCWGRRWEGSMPWPVSNWMRDICSCSTNWLPLFPFFPLFSYYSCGLPCLHIRDSCPVIFKRFLNLGGYGRVQQLAHNLGLIPRTIWSLSVLWVHSWRPHSIAGVAPVFLLLHESLICLNKNRTGGPPSLLSTTNNLQSFRHALWPGIGALLQDLTKGWIFEAAEWFLPSASWSPGRAGSDHDSPETDFWFKIPFRWPVLARSIITRGWFTFPLILITTSEYSLPYMITLLGKSTALFLGTGVTASWKGHSV